MSYIGTTEIGKMFLGDVEIDKAYLGNDLVFSGEQVPLVPVFYNYLYFTRPAYIETEYLVPYRPSFKVELGKETVNSGTQRIVRFGSGSNLMAIQYASNTTASSGRRWGIYYCTSSNGSSNRVLAWSTETFEFFITYSRFGWDTTSYTYSKASNTPTVPLVFGSDANSYSGRMGTFYVYNSDTQNVTSLSGLSSYTPVATFRPCTYGGAAGFWHVEANKFYGNSASSGSLTASNT